MSLLYAVYPARFPAQHLCFLHFSDLSHSHLLAHPFRSRGTSHFLSRFKDVLPLPRKRRLFNHKELFSPSHPDSLLPVSSQLLNQLLLAHEDVRVAPVDASSHPESAFPFLSLDKIHILVPSTLQHPPFLPPAPSPHIKPQLILKHLSSRSRPRSQARPVSLFVKQFFQRKQPRTHALPFPRMKKLNSQRP